MEVGKQLKFTERNIKVQDQRGQIPRKTNVNVNENTIYAGYMENMMKLLTTYWQDVEC